MSEMRPVLLADANVVRGVYSCERANTNAADDYILHMRVIARNWYLSDSWRHVDFGHDPTFVEHMTPHAIHVIDDAMPQPEDYRAAALYLEFHDIQPSESVTFHGMAEIGHSPLSALLEQRFGLTTTWSGFRLSPEGQEEPNYIHTDQDMGEWTAILYLHPEPPTQDGTTFWKSKQTGEIQSVATDPQEKYGEWVAWRDLSQWEPWHTVPARFNRLLLFPAPYFHSRAIFENYGAGDDARLIQLCFGTGVLPCV